MQSLVLLMRFIARCLIPTRPLVKMRLFIVAFLLALAAYIFAIPPTHLVMLDNTRKAIKMFRAGPVLSDPPRLNPVHLSLANTAYRIQSQTLGIPDRFGIFSTGPPRLQVWEAHWAVFFAFIHLFLAVYVLCVLFMFWMMKVRNFGRIALMIIGTWVGSVVFFWYAIIARRDEMGPDYVWKDWSPDMESKTAG